MSAPWVFREVDGYGAVKLSHLFAGMSRRFIDSVTWPACPSGPSVLVRAVKLFTQVRVPASDMTFRGIWGRGWCCRLHAFIR